MIGEHFIRGLGAATLDIARHAGGMVVLLGQVLRALVPPSLDGREFLRNLYKMGNRSIPIVLLTAFFTGAIMVFQSGVLIKRVGATALLGWAGGYIIFRELGPVLIAIMFSGRVGSNNAAELGTMTITEQLDGLRVLAIDPIRYLIVPRILAMMLALLALTLIGNLIALLGSMLFAHVLFGVEYSTLFFSFVENVKIADLMHGLTKAVFFGIAIALSSCYFGITVRGGAVGVGRAVNASVVAGAISVLLLDFLLAYLLP